MTQGAVTSQSGVWIKRITLVVILVLLVGAGVWAAKTWFFTSSKSGEIDIGEEAEQPRQFQFRADGVHSIGANLYRVDAGDYFMTLAPTETSFAPMRLFLNRRDLPGDQRLLIRLCAETQNASFAKSLSITDDQSQKLKAIREQVGDGMTITDADRDKLRGLWKTWIDAKDKAAKTAAEQPLMDAMREIGGRNTQATMKHYADVADQIHAVVTSDQISHFRQLRRG